MILIVNTYCSDPKCLADLDKMHTAKVEKAQQLILYYMEILYAHKFKQKMNETKNSAVVCYVIGAFYQSQTMRPDKSKKT